MRTVQMTLDEDLVETVDKTCKRFHTTRSAFTREALYAALKLYQKKAQEKKHKIGYLRKPVKLKEFSDWEDEQVWID